MSMPGPVGEGEPNSFIEDDHTQITHLPHLEEVAKTNIFELLAEPDDEVFINSLDTLREIAPEPTLSLQRTPKFPHTFEVLSLLDTSEMDQREKFIARAAALMHDAELPLVAEEITHWVQAGHVDRDTARRIIRHVWWHDFLGKVGEGNYSDINDIYKLFPNPRDRKIHAVIHLADISSYEAFQYVVPVVKERIASINFTDEVNPDSDLLDFEKAKELGLLSVEYRNPVSDEIFIHGIRHKSMGTFVMSNILGTDGKLKSYSRLNRAERSRIYFASGKNGNLGGASSGINATRGTKSETELFQQSAVTFIFTPDALLRAKTGVVNSVAQYSTLVNCFTSSGDLLGGEVPITSSKIIIDIGHADTSPEFLREMLALIRAEVTFSLDDPENWLANNLIFYDSHHGSDMNEIVRSLLEGSFDILERNQTLLNLIADEVIRGIPNGLVDENGNSFTKLARRVLSSKSRRKSIYATEKEVRSHPANVDRLSILRTLCRDFPEIANRVEQSFRVKGESYIREYGSLYKEVIENGGNLYDPKRKLFFYAENSGIIVVPSETDPTGTVREYCGNDQAWKVTQRGEIYEVNDSSW